MSPALMSPRQSFDVCLCDDGHHDGVDVIDSFRTQDEAVADLTEHRYASWQHLVARTATVVAVP